MTPIVDPHAWFRERIDLYLLDGLTAEKRELFTAHALDCAPCQSALHEAQTVDRSLRSLFAATNPSPDFEEKLIMNLRTLPTARLIFQANVLRAAAGLAAAVMLGGVGLIGHRVMKDGKFPTLALPDLSLPRFASLFSGKSPQVEHPSADFRAGLVKSQSRLSEVDRKSSPDSTGADWRLAEKQFGREAVSRQLPRLEKLDTDVDSAFTFGLKLPEQLAEESELKLQQNVAMGREKGQLQGLGYKTQPALAFDVPPEPSLTHSKTPPPAVALGVSVNGVKLAYGETTRGDTVIDSSGVSTPGITVLNSDALRKPALAGAGGEGRGTSHGALDYYSLTSTGKNSQPEGFYFKPDVTQPLGSVVYGLRAGLLVNASKDSKDPGAKSLPETPQETKEADAKEVAGRPVSAPVQWSANLADSDAPKPAATDVSKAEEKPAVPQIDPQTVAQQKIERKIIRNGQMEFEVDSFDSSFIQIGKIVGEEGGFVSSTDSEKLSNGKVKGTITVRVPPDHLDVLVLKLRGLGDLKNQRIAAQDITKQYTDLESGLRAARTMETRLLEIIKNGKGEVKDLVEAEKQLGIYREKIEQIEGELRYYSNLVSLSTLNITLMERDLKTPTAAFETEEVQAGIEVEDVEKARREALSAIDEAKGRVIESSLKKLDAGQLTATIVAELTPEAAGAFSDRLQQLGRVARMEADRKQVTQGGVGAPTGVKMVRKATRFNISLYNLANIQPRETVTLTLASDDVEKAYKTILAAMNSEDASMGRVVTSTLNNPKPDQVTGDISLDVKSDKAASIESIIRGVGDVMHIEVAENVDTTQVTRSKRKYNVRLVSMAQIPPRETVTLQIIARSVPAEYTKLLAALHDAKQPSRIFTSQLNEQDRQNVTGQVEVDVPRSAVAAAEAALSGSDSDVYSRNVVRADETQNTLDTKVRLSITILSADHKPPRETTSIAVEVPDVEKVLGDVVSSVETAGGRVVERQLAKRQDGRIAAHAIVDVPLTSAPATLDKLRGLGTVRMVESTKDQQAPEGPLARARFDLTLSDAEPILTSDRGVGPSLRKGLQTSLDGLTFSLTLIVIGVCLVAPFALVVWGGWKLFRRGKVTPVKG